MRLPYAGLETLVAFADAGALKGAARALNVTEGAVSKQLKLLQDHVQAPLFEKHGGRLRLTQAGRHLAAAAGDGFEQISTAIEQLQSSQKARPLRVACVPTFFAHWLLPRIGALNAAAPDLEIEFLAKPNAPEIASADADFDALIDVGRLPVDGAMTISAFMPDYAGPVATPAYLDSLGGVATLSDLARAKWLFPKSRSEAVPQWMMRHTSFRAEAVSVKWFDNVFLCLQAARAGLGVTLASHCYIEADLADGRLAAPFGVQAGEVPFYVAWPPQLVGQQAKLKRLIAWLKKEGRQVRAPKEQILSGGKPQDRAEKT